MNKQNRRDFLQSSAALAAGAVGVGLTEDALLAKEEAATQRDPNDQLRVAVIGVKGRGRAHIDGLANRHGCVVTTICDADSSVIGPAMKTVEQRQGKAPRFEQDIRKVVEDKNIDIVAIATPNHWHALAAIWAMQNDKDVYVEKPVSHNVSEGRRIVETARKHKRICQAGTQIRSMPGIRKAIEFIHAGKLGKVKVARGLCYKRRGSIGDTKGPQPLPKTVDYDLWCGPAPKKPLMRARLHYDWHWIWDYGNGDLGNQGIHQMDVARWALGKGGLSKSVVAVGGRFGYIDDGETANTHISVFDYGDSELIFEVRGLASNNPYPFGVKKDVPRGKNFVGNVIECADGVVAFPDYGNAFAFTHKGELVEKFGGGGDHFGNFVEGVRSRNAKVLNGDIEEGHLSSALCHLGNLSYQLGSAVSFEKGKSVYADDKAAQATYERTQEHLKSNKIAESTGIVAGKLLRVNAETESFIDDKEANALLTREYRKGFEVPSKV